MPDEVQFVAGAKATPPAGTKIATDTVGGKEIQFVKLDIGADGLSNPVVDALPVYDVSGTVVTVNIGNVFVTGSIQVSNFPAVQDVNIVSGTISATFTPPIQQGISGSVSVSNFPIQQGISGTVFVGNFPATQDVAIVSGSLIIVGSSDMVEVSGTVSVANFPSMQGISGTVFVGNFPSQQGISGTVTAIPVGIQGISGSVSVNRVGFTPSAPTGTSVGVASVLIVSSNVNRRGLVLINTSTNWISLGFGTTAVLYRGITLSPGGSSFVMDDFTYCTSAVYAIASKTNSNIAVQEFVT